MNLCLQLCIILRYDVSKFAGKREAGNGDTVIVFIYPTYQDLIDADVDIGAFIAIEVGFTFIHAY